MKTMLIISIINPVKHQYVEQAIDWLYSTIHTYISKGLLNNDWEGVENNLSEIEWGGEDYDDYLCWGSCRHRHPTQHLP